MKVVGPLVDLETPNKRMKAEFYGGDLWKNELETIAMPMLESYDVILCETTWGFVFDDLREVAK